MEVLLGDESTNNAVLQRAHAAGDVVAAVDRLGDDPAYRAPGARADHRVIDGAGTHELHLEHLPDLYERTVILCNFENETLYPGKVITNEYLSATLMIKSLQAASQPPPWVRSQEIIGGQEEDWILSWVEAPIWDVLPSMTAWVGYEGRHGFPSHLSKQSLRMGGPSIYRLGPNVGRPDCIYIHFPGYNAYR
eukprot:scaffold199346_cov17-Tisochrysis_lutea.AAC.2